MVSRRIEIPKSTLKKFYSQSPSSADKDVVKATLKSISENPDIGEEVPFQQYQDAYVVWGGPWRILYQKGNPVIHVLQIERESS
ncbi:MAG TPA: type II toxin-antitoxin system RelE/ParE family toxin [Terriglobales bacterium]|nr:type II toxin-antitoxin system RelE/ParE family toxin [Terriglobales bacterium]